MQTLFKEITPKRYANGNEMKENSSNVLDQYFTKPSVALKCFQKACEVIKKHEKLDDFIHLKELEEIANLIKELGKILELD